MYNDLIIATPPVISNNQSNMNAELCMQRRQ